MVMHLWDLMGDLVVLVESDLNSCSQLTPTEHARWAGRWAACFLGVNTLRPHTVSTTDIPTSQTQTADRPGSEGMAEVQIRTICLCSVSTLAL